MWLETWRSFVTSEIVAISNENICFASFVLVSFSPSRVAFATL